MLKKQAEERQKLVNKYNDARARYGTGHVKTRKMQQRLAEFDSKHGLKS